MSGDSERMLFLIGRESDPQKVIDFADQATSQYRKASLASKRKYGRGGAYRVKYATSYLFHKMFLKLNTQKIPVAED